MACHAWGKLARSLTFDAVPPRWKTLLWLPQRLWGLHPAFFALTAVIYALFRRGTPRKENAKGAVFGFVRSLFIIGLHIAVSRFTIAMVGALWVFGNAMMMWGRLTSFVHVAIPPLVFMGAILLRAGVTGQICRALSDRLRPLPLGAFAQQHHQTAARRVLTR